MSTRTGSLDFGSRSSIENVILDNRIDDPSVVAAGLFYYNTVTGYIRYCNGGAWMNVEHQSNRVNVWSDVPSTIKYPSEKLTKDSLDTITLALSTHNHNLNDLTEKSYNSLSDKPDLSNLHTHSNKTDLDNVSGTNTGDETAQTIIDKIGNGTTIDSDYLPSYVDDVIEGYYNSGVFYSDIAETIPIIPETGKIYMDIKNDNNDEYRWTGSVYGVITNPLDYASQAEAEAGTDETKVINTKQTKNSILYQLANATISALNTTAKTVIGAINELLGKIVISWSATTLNTNIPSEKLVKDSLDVKADITPANGATSALRELFIARGAGLCTYDTNTNLYMLNGIPHTEAEIMNCYIYTAFIDWGNTAVGLLSYFHMNIKTIFPPLTSFIYNTTGNYYRLFILNSTITHINFSPLDTTRGLRGVAYVELYRGCINLVDGGMLTVDIVTNSANLANVLFDCFKLETIKIHVLKVSFSFAWSPLLSLASLQYLVTNRANGTTRITITVHPTVYAKLTDSVWYPTWNALLVDAYNNQYIDFASA